MKNLTIFFKNKDFSSVGDIRRNFAAGAYLIRGEFQLDKTHILKPEENALLITSVRKNVRNGAGEISHSLVICSQGAFFDDVKVWSSEDIKSLQAAIDIIQNTKQDRTDQTLATQARSVAGAINEIFCGGVMDKSIEAIKLAQAVQDTLGMVGTNVKVLPKGISLTSDKLEDGIWIVLPTNNNPNPPSWLFGYHVSLLVVSKPNGSVMILGVDGSEKRLPAFAVRRYYSTSWEGSRLLSGDKGAVKSDNIEDGAVIFTKLAESSVTYEKIADEAVTEPKIAPRAVTEEKIVDGAVTEDKLGARLLSSINGAVQKDAISAVKLTDNSTQNAAAIDARITKLAKLKIDITNGYAIPISYISGNKEYHGMVTAGKNSLLNGIVSDAQGQSYFGISVGATDGIVTFEESDPLVFKSEMSSAIDTLVECVEFTKTTLSNKAHLDAYLAKLPNAKVMCCTYNGGYAGILHKINGSWYGVLVSESNTLAGQLSIKLQADGTIVEGTA